MSFQDKIVVVSGGTRGIGRAITIAFAREGANVVALYQSRDEAAQQLLEECVGGLQGKIQTIKASVEDASAIQELMFAIKQKYGRIDVLVNNAGIFKTGLLALTKSADCHKIIDTNLKGTIFTTLAVVRLMMQQKQGYIINISSIVTSVPFMGASVYTAAKAGVAAFTESLASELAPYGIIVTCLAPGLTATEMIQNLSPSVQEEYMGLTDSGRLLQPEEVAARVLELAGPEAEKLRGQTVIIKG